MATKLPAHKLIPLYNQMRCLTTTTPTLTLSLSNNFEADFAKHHKQLSPLQKGLLTIGSSVISITNPARGDMIACLGEVVGQSAFEHILEKMSKSPEGRRILEQRPRINSGTVDLDRLKMLPNGTLGREFVRFLQVNNVTPDTRNHVEFIDNIEHAYVVQRYREVHDLTHTVLQMPTNMLGEVTVKCFEAVQTRLPMCVAGAIFGAARLKPKQRANFVKLHQPWAMRVALRSQFLMNAYFEERWEQKMVDFHREFGIFTLETTVDGGA